MQYTYFLFYCALLGILCLGKAQNGLTEEGKQELLDAHNNLRGIVNPPAANMLKMEWSDELAEIAQNYAELCNLGHNENRDSQSQTYSSVGENIKVTSATKFNYADSVQAWYDEVAMYNYDTNVCSGVCGHYTQVVWASSSAVGCGAKRCPSVIGFSDPDSVIIVCNYGPAGNVNGQRPYEHGAYCSSCPSNYPACASNLCAVAEQETGSPSPSQPTPELTTQVAMETFTQTNTESTPLTSMDVASVPMPSSADIITEIAPMPTTSHKSVASSPIQTYETIATAPTLGISESVSLSSGSSEQIRASSTIVLPESSKGLKLTSSPIEPPIASHTSSILVPSSTQVTQTSTTLAMPSSTQPSESQTATLSFQQPVPTTTQTGKPSKVSPLSSSAKAPTPTPSMPSMSLGH